MTDDTVFYGLDWKIRAIVGRESVADAFNRLVAENAAMREIVEAVAHGDMTAAQEDLGTTPICVFGCGGHEDPDAIGKFIHTAECQWTKARALLGLETE